MNSKWMLLFALILVFFIFFTNCGKKATVSENFQEGIKLTTGEEPIDIRIGHLVPTIADWNNDGKKDMIVGQFAGGKINLYLNQGTDELPKFGEPIFLKAGGEEVSLPAG